MPFKKILIASVLKPVDDNRLYHKIALGLAPHYEVHLIGYEGHTLNSAYQNIHLHGAFRFGRTSLVRWTAIPRLIKCLNEIKPDFLIISAVELLPIVFYLKIKANKLKKIKIIYDIQEDYFKNIISQNVYPGLLKPILATFLRLLEKKTAKYISLYVLAEKNYKDDIAFLKTAPSGSVIVLENKLPNSIGTSKKEINISYKEKTELKILIYGNISENYGTEKAILIINQLNLIQTDCIYTLTIVGNCFIEKYLEKLTELASIYKYIHLNIKNKPIKYELVLDYLKQSDIVLMPYQINESNKDRIPTKFYECLAFHKPMLISLNSYWKSFLEPHQCSIFYNLDNLNFFKLHIQIRESIFYPYEIKENTYSSKNDLNYLVECIKKL